jgi:hypothetical protein
VGEGGSAAAFAPLSLVFIFLEALVVGRMELGCRCR